MVLPESLKKLTPVSGEYILIERDKVADLYAAAGFSEDDEEVPNYITIDGKECLFTEKFIEKDGVEYEIAMISEGFSWEDLLIYDEDDEDFE